MSQHALTIANQAGASFRSDIVNALQALGSNNSGATGPGTTYPYMWWPDTTTGILKQRNAANSAWINILTMATGFPLAAAAPGANADITSLTALTGITGNPTVTGTLKVTTGAAVGGATAGSGGLAFPATAVAVADANTLDDYEEGTWTGSFACGTSGSITLSNTVGIYIKVGAIVHITGVFDVLSVSSPVGTLTLNGLPFTSANNNQNSTAVSIFVQGGFATSLDGNVVEAMILKNTSAIEINYVSQTTGTLGSNMAGACKANTSFSINASYAVV